MTAPGHTASPNHRLSSLSNTSVADMRRRQQQTQSRQCYSIRYSKEQAHLYLSIAGSLNQSLSNQSGSASSSSGSCDNKLPRSESCSSSIPAASFASTTDVSRSGAAVLVMMEDCIVGVSVPESLVEVLSTVATLLVISLFNASMGAGEWFRPPVLLVPAFCASSLNKPSVES